MLTTERLIIRLMEFEDLEILRNLHNSEKTLQWLTDIFHVSKDEQIEWFSKMSSSRKNRRYTILTKEINKIVGIARLDDIDLVNKNAFIGVDIEADFRRQGFARETYRCLIDYAFNSLNLHRLSLVTLENNMAAQNLYIELGFKTEGMATQAILRDGTYTNLVCMYLLNSKL